MAAIHYRQIVKRKSDNKVSHDETGYWMWDAETKILMHSLAIPRAVSVLAGGIYDVESNTGSIVILKISAKLNATDWQIIQLPFMQEYARTTEFHHQITVGSGKFSYTETTTVEIYGKVFEHTDQNELILQ